MAADTDTLRRTPLHDRHVAAGARLVPFAGWEMPVQYPAGIRAEHTAVRERAGVFDVSHMGQIETRGPGAGALLQRLVSNDVTTLAEGGAQYALLCNEDGGVLDDLFTYRLGPDRYLTVTNAANHARDLAWFEAHAAGRRRRRDRPHRGPRDARRPGPARPRARRCADRRRAARALPHRRADRRRRARRAGLRHRLHGGGRRRAARRPRATRPRSGTPSSPAAPSPPAWARATRCAPRPASTSTATTCPRTAARSRPASAGRARRRRASSGTSASRATARRAPPSGSSRSRSPARASPARATRWSAAAS